MAVVADASDHPLIVSLREMRREGDEWPYTSVQGAYLFAAAGDAERTAALLQEARKLGFRDARRLRHSPFFRKVRTSPAFAAVLAGMEEDAAVQRRLIEQDSRLAAIVEVD